MKNLSPFNSEIPSLKPDLSLYGVSMRRKEKDLKKVLNDNETHSTSMPISKLEHTQDMLSEKDMPKPKKTNLMDKLTSLVETLEHELEYSLDIMFNDTTSHLNNVSTTRNNNIIDFRNRLEIAPLIFQYDPADPDSLSYIADATNLPSGVVHQFFDNSVDRAVAESSGLQTVALWVQPNNPEEIQALRTSNKPENQQSLMSSFPNATFAQPANKSSIANKKPVTLTQFKNKRETLKPLVHLNPNIVPKMTPNASISNWMAHNSIIDAKEFLKGLMTEDAAKRGKIRGHSDYMELLSDLGIAPDADNYNANHNNQVKMAM